MFTLLLIIFLLFFIIIEVIFALFLLITSFTGAPYLATTKTAVLDIVKISNLKKGSKVIDLGSGDGRIVIEFAKKGFEAYGVELNIFYVILENIKIKTLGLTNAHIIWGNLFKTDLSKYDAIVCYGITYIMPKLEKKILKEAKLNVKIISNIYKFKKLKQVKKLGSIRLYNE